MSSLQTCNSLFLMWTLVLKIGSTVATSGCLGPKDVFHERLPKGITSTAILFLCFLCCVCVVLALGFFTADSAHSVINLSTSTWNRASYDFLALPTPSTKIKVGGSGMGHATVFLWWKQEGSAAKILFSFSAINMSGLSSPFTALLSLGPTDFPFLMCWRQDWWNS